ncbi:MAG: peptidase MA family metallohydrolase [Dehalococcoidia bacterium]|nr:peptidase MA family metallohydrolase [Dehalococcoidia bacterium]
MFKKAILLISILIVILGFMSGMVSSYPLEVVDYRDAPSEISSISVITSKATPQFPEALVFEVQAGSDVPIVDVRLHFSVECDSFVKVVTEEKLNFTSSTKVSASYVWDMRYTGSLPTGTIVDYWWTITDSTGGKLTTEHQKVYFSDTRYSWKSMQQDKITLYWYSGSDAFAQRLLNTAIQGLSDLEASTGASLSRQVSIYVYSNTSDMLGAMLFAQEWTGGVAFTSYSTIIIGINDFNIAWGERALVHELTHMVNYQMTSNPYNHIPVWLDEGLAMYAEGPLESSFKEILVSALASDKLFSVRSMSSPFSTDSNLARQEYAQSYSIVDFLISQYGSTKMTALLAAFRQGSTYDDAMQAVYGFDMDGLYQAWLAFAEQKYITLSQAG